MPENNDFSLLESYDRYEIKQKIYELKWSMGGDTASHRMELLFLRLKELENMPPNPIFGKKFQGNNQVYGKGFFKNEYE